MSAYILVIDSRDNPGFIGCFYFGLFEIVFAYAEALCKNLRLPDGLVITRGL